MEATLLDQLDCAKRELSLRGRVYPKWIGDGRLSRERAESELNCMRAIVRTLEKLIYLQQVSDEMKAQQR